MQNNQDPGLRFGASLLALYRAKELFNIDPRRVYTSGLSGGARVASTLAFLHSELITGTAPSSGFGMPRLNEVTPNYIPNTSSNQDSYFFYANGYFYEEDVNPVNASAIANKLRSYLITREGDHREDYFVEAFHCAYEPQGLTAFLYDGPGGHQDASNDEMRDAIDYLDRNDTYPVDARASNSFAKLSNISQSGAQAVTSGSVKRLTPSLGAVAAVKSDNSVYWDNRNGSTFRWLWEVAAASPQNQKTSFGVWFNGETWKGGAPTSLAAASNPGFLVTITQTAAGNRMVISARPDADGETIFYDGSFTFTPAYATAYTSPQTGYLSGTGAPVEMRLELNEKRFQINFNGIVLGTTTTIANGTRVSNDTKRAIFGAWDTALGSAFWKHDPSNSAQNTWLPLTKAIFTAATGAASASGVAPAPLDLRYVLASDPGRPQLALTQPVLPATFYQNCSFGGYAVNLSAGSYTLSQLTAAGIRDNDLSSVKVPAGYSVTLYENDNFTGQSLALTSDNSCLIPAGFNDRTTSLKIVSNATPARSAPASQAASQEVDKLQPSVNVYPNPTSGGDFNLDLAGFSQKESVQITIRNTTGQLVFSSTIESTDTKALHQNAKLSQGIYLVTVRSNSLLTTQKLVVE